MDGIAIQVWCLVTDQCGATEHMFEGQVVFPLPFMNEKDNTCHLEHLSLGAEDSTAGRHLP